MDSPLTGLDLRIATALQVDPRASWRRIAQVLDAPERTVARRGQALLADGVVEVAAVRILAEAALVRVQCAPGAVRVAAESLAQRADTTFACAATGGADCVVELVCGPGRLRSVLVNEIPATVGMARAHTYPILRYFRTVREWTAGALTPEQRAALHPPPGPDLEGMDPTYTEPSAVDALVAEALMADGRAGVEAVARRAGVSETTAARRISALIAERRLQIRALVEPADVGLPVEALLWITASPGRVDQLGRALAEDPRTRYAVAVAGDHQIVADVTCRTNQELYELVTGSDWVHLAGSVDATLVLHARKRGGRFRPWVG